MNSYDISAVITAHNEGLLIVPSLRSAIRNVLCAEAEGFSVEILIILDSADALTKSVVENSKGSNTRIIEVKCGDPGLARNEATRVAKGEWVAFLDGDDLWGESWLLNAVRAARYDRRAVVWHPEVSVYFGEARRIYRHIDMESAEYDPLGLVIQNYWTALHFSPRDLMLDVPYVATGPVGYEDWDWNVNAVKAGAIHKVVKGTGHGIRIKDNSRLKSSNNARSSLSPTNLFRKIIVPGRRFAKRCGN